MAHVGVKAWQGVPTNHSAGERHHPPYEKSFKVNFRFALQMCADLSFFSISNRLQRGSSQNVAKIKHLCTQHVHVYIFCGLGERLPFPPFWEIFSSILFSFYFLALPKCDCTFRTFSLQWCFKRLNMSAVCCSILERWVLAFRSVNAFRKKKKKISRTNIRTMNVPFLLRSQLGNAKFLSFKHSKRNLKRLTKSSPLNKQREAILF